MSGLSARQKKTRNTIVALLTLRGALISHHRNTDYQVRISRIGLKFVRSYLANSRQFLTAATRKLCLLSCPTVGVGVAYSVLRSPKLPLGLALPRSAPKRTPTPAAPQVGLKAEGVCSQE